MIGGMVGYRRAPDDLRRRGRDRPVVRHQQHPQAGLLFERHAGRRDDAIPQECRALPPAGRARAAGAPAEPAKPSAGPAPDDANRDCDERLTDTKSRRGMTEALTMDIQEVMRRLPHRYPFLLVDRVLECISGQVDPRAQERDGQRAVLPRAFPASAGAAGRHHPRGAGADRGHPRLRDRRRVPGREPRSCTSSASTRRASAGRSCPATS